VNDSNIDNAVDRLQEQIRKYQKFLKTTNEGKVAFELCDDKIRECNSILAMSDVDLVARFAKAGVAVIDKDVIDAYRSECRGALLVWYAIRDDLGDMEKELRRLGDLKGKKEEGDKKREEVVKKYG
jgi:hypothetical protein